MALRPGPRPDALQGVAAPERLWRPGPGASERRAGYHPQAQSTPWRIRASRELWAVDAAAGRVADPEGLRSASFSDPVTLTPMDREIAELAAAGLTNRQIGDRLYLSYRTVAAHLYQIFPRLGITSRAALRDALDMLGESARSDD